MLTAIPDGVTGLVDALSANAHIIGPALLVIVLLALAYAGRGWPDLWPTRRVVLPALEAVDQYLVPRLPAAIRHDPTLTGEFPPAAYAGSLPDDPETVRRRLIEMPTVEPRNLAMQKYLRRDGVRVYAVGSYAYLPEGQFSAEQTHIRLVPGEHGGTDIYAHHEQSPWMAPVEHYDSHEIDYQAGVTVARSLLNIRPDDTTERHREN